MLPYNVNLQRRHIVCNKFPIYLNFSSFYLSENQPAGYSLKKHIEVTEDEMVGWHHGLNGHEFEQTPGDSEGQGSLAGYSPQGRKESDMT